MDWGNLFFGFSGRTNRAKFWIAALVYAAVSVLLAILVYVTDQNGVFQAINGMLNIVILISGIAAGVKRLHDRNRSGWYLLLFYVLPGILGGSIVVVGATTDETTIVTTILGLLAFAISVWAFVEMACLRGTIGVNPYGPDPVGPTIVPPIRTPV